MSEHYNEPWRTKTGNPAEFADSEGQDVGFCDRGLEHSVDALFAARIVACVNFCAGVSSDDLNGDRDQALVLLADAGREK